MDSFDSLGIVDYNLHRRQHNPVLARARDDNLIFFQNG